MDSSYDDLDAYELVTAVREETDLDYPRMRQLVYELQGWNL